MKQKSKGVQRYRRWIILMVIFCFVGGIIYVNQDRVNDTLVGTYKTEGVKAMYYVLEDDSSYCKYRQYSILKKGTYKVNGEKILLDDGEKLTLEDKKLYDKENNIYTKFSNTPTYINVEAE